jgi:hypothetical protein
LGPDHPHNSLRSSLCRFKLWGDIDRQPRILLNFHGHVAGSWFRAGVVILPIPRSHLDIAFRTKFTWNLRVTKGKHASAPCTSSLFGRPAQRAYALWISDREFGIDSRKKIALYSSLVYWLAAVKDRPSSHFNHLVHEFIPSNMWLD